MTIANLETCCSLDRQIRVTLVLETRSKLYEYLMTIMKLGAVKQSRCIQRLEPAYAVRVAQVPLPWLLSPVHVLRTQDRLVDRQPLAHGHGQI